MRTMARNGRVVLAAAALAAAVALAGPRGGSAQGYPFQMNWGLLECLAAHRQKPPANDPLCVRFVRDVP